VRKNGFEVRKCPSMNQNPGDALVVEPTHLKNVIVKMGSSSPNRVEN